MTSAEGEPFQSSGPDQGGTHAGLGTAGRLALSAGLFGISALLQCLGGLWTGSLGLLSDALENLNDVIVNLLGLTSLQIANRKEPCDRYTYGWHRLEVFNMLAGGLLLLVLAGSVSVEAFHRLRSPLLIQTGWVIFFASMGLLLNLLATLALRPRNPVTLKKDANLKTAYIHAFSDALSSVALLASMLLMRYTGWRWLDPLIALAIVVLILRGAFMLIRDAAGILMHRAAFDHAAAKARLLELPGVKGVEDLRSWKVCSHLVVCTAHVQVEAVHLEETERYREAIEQLLGAEFEVRHLTLHFETESMAGRHEHHFNHRHDSPLGHELGHRHDHDR